MKKTRRLTTFALLAALAMILSFLESQIPALVAIPGVKVGLANIAVIFALYRLGVKEAIIISAIRIIAVSMLFGTPVSAIYSFGGAAVSFLIMILLKKFTPASEVSVSVAGAVGHNIGQIIVACILLETNVIIYYLPFLLLSGSVAGTVIGLISALVIRRVRIKKQR